MSYKAYVAKLKNVRAHGNADRLLLGDCFGNTVCVSTEYIEGQIGIYFPEGGQLSEEFCEHNNLVRKKDENGKNIGGYLDPDKRNIVAIRLRGEKSEGLFLPISCLDYTGGSDFKEGDIVNVVNGKEICQKYVPYKPVKSSSKEGNKTRKKKVDIAPLFKEHVDTEQLAYNLNDFKDGDIVEITLKLHGTSQRTGYLPVLKGYKRSILDRILRKEGKPIYEYDYVSGTRRTVLTNYEGGFYGNDEFRKIHSDKFAGKLLKGETVYYEVVGFITDGTPIMGTCSNKKINDKDIVKQYGDTTVFSYGCSKNGCVEKWGSDKWGTFKIPFEVPQSDIYVYRMTMINEDGDVVEYDPAYMRYRCEQIGVKSVPAFDTFIVKEPDGYTSEWNPGDFVRMMAEEYFDGPDPIGKNHIREGVVCRIVNRPKFTAYKHKNFNFKVITGIAKPVGEVSDDIAEEM